MVVECPAVEPSSSSNVVAAKRDQAVVKTVGASFAGGRRLCTRRDAAPRSVSAQPSASGAARRGERAGARTLALERAHWPSSLSSAASPRLRSPSLQHTRLRTQLDRIKWQRGAAACTATWSQRDVMWRGSPMGLQRDQRTPRMSVCVLAVRAGEPAQGGVPVGCSNARGRRP